MDLSSPPLDLSMLADPLEDRSSPRLPLELLAHIVKDTIIDLVEDRKWAQAAQVGLVCRSLLPFAREALYHTVILFPERILSKYTDPNACMRHCIPRQHLSRVREVHLFADERRTDINLEATAAYVNAIRGMDRLESIVIATSSTLDDVGVEAMVDYLQTLPSSPLRRYDLGDPDDLPETLEALSRVDALQHLRVHDLPSSVAAAEAPALSELTSMRLETAQSPTDDGIQWLKNIGRQGKATLRHLCLPGSISYSKMHLFPALTSLEIVCLDIRIGDEAQLIKKTV